VSLYRQFPGRFENVAEARRFVTDALLVGSEVYEAARLLVDEAITNPLLHSSACDASQAFEVTVAFRPDLLHVEVRDAGVPFELGGDDGQRPVSVAGRSLELFDALAVDWDSTADRSGHVVWFELAS
jgi:Histidine kinase-like ATPase domain